LALIVISVTVVPYPSFRSDFVLFAASIACLLAFFVAYILAASPLVRAIIRGGLTNRHATTRITIRRPA
jgi:hypothetical protein